MLAANNFAVFQIGSKNADFCNKSQKLSCKAKNIQQGANAV